MTAIPKGFRLVPIEPTRAMMNAAADWIGHDERWFERSPQWKGEVLYAAMIAAAPEAVTDAGHSFERP